MLIIIKGKPKPLKRHRHTKKGFTYDPSYKDKKEFILKASYKKPVKPLEGALRMQLAFYFYRPKKHFRTGRYSKELKKGVPYWHTTTPDLDNLEKMVADALEMAGFYKNDSYIAQKQSEKIYCNPGEESRTEINLIQIDDGDKE